MKNFKLLSVLTLAVLMGVSCSKDDLQSATENESAALKVTAGKSPTDFSTTARATGSDAPNGAHYNLNIIGVPKEKSADMTGNNGGRIFVPLAGKTKIMLIEGSDYAVLDANGTDGSASFQLPNPDTDGDGVSSYSIYARALGTPGGSVTIRTCADADLTDGYVEVCSAEPLTLTRTKGGAPKFSNVSTELLTILVPTDILNADGSVLLESGRYTIFDDALENYFWEYDNNGLKLLQLRFYEIPTAINVP
jgi:hypothetical protein